MLYFVYLALKGFESGLVVFIDELHNPPAQLRVLSQNHPSITTKDPCNNVRNFVIVLG
jgi:hypothetical protein